jgi:condensation domain-containing protein
MTTITRAFPATFPVSYPQESLWSPDGLSSINVPSAVRFRGRPSPSRVTEVLGRSVARHGALRTVLGRSADGALEQRVYPDGRLGLESFRHSTTLERGFAALLLAGSEIPFSLDGGPLARAELHSFSDDDHLLIVWMHHVISDLASSHALASEIRRLYAGADPGPVDFHMGDFAAAQRAVRPDPEQQRYWERVLDGADSRLGIPFPGTREHQGIRPALPPLRPELVAALEKLAAAHRTTFTAVLATAVIAAHAPGAESGRVVIGLTISNRDRPRLRPVLGCLADQLPLAVDIGGDPAFSVLLGRVRSALLDAYDYRLPLGVLLRWLGRPDPPVFTVNLNFLPPRPLAADPPPAGPAPTSDIEFPSGVVKKRADRWWLGDAVLAYRPRIERGGLGGEIEGDAAVHDLPEVVRFGERFRALLATVAQAPQTSLSALAARG